MGGGSSKSGLQTCSSADQNTAVFLKLLFITEGKLLLVPLASSFPSRVTTYTSSKRRREEGTALHKIGCADVYVRGKVRNHFLNNLIGDKQMCRNKMMQGICAFLG